MEILKTGGVEGAQPTPGCVNEKGAQVMALLLVVGLRCARTLLLGFRKASAHSADPP